MRYCLQDEDYEGLKDRPRSGCARHRSGCGEEVDISQEGGEEDEGQEGKEEGDLSLLSGSHSSTSAQEVKNRCVSIRRPSQDSFYSLVFCDDPERARFTTIRTVNETNAMVIMTQPTRTNGVESARAKAFTKSATIRVIAGAFVKGRLT